MALPHARPGEPIDIRPLGVGLPAANTVALFKSDDLEVMRVVDGVAALEDSSALVTIALRG